MKTALITGISGQDGAYLAQWLLKQGYHVVGGVRRSSTLNDWRLKALGIEDKIQMVDLELTEQSNVRRIIKQYQPDEIYNLAAQSFVGVSFEQPVYTTQVNGLPVLYLLEAQREYAPEARFYQASTSEMFGKVCEVPQTESTPFHPRSPYGVAKLYGHWITTNYREAYDVFAASGILFNHESPLRGTEFVTRKITHTLAQIAHGNDIVLELGNLEAKRDWGFAGDYVKAMWKMLQVPNADNFVIATGKTHTVRAFAERAMAQLDLETHWEGDGENESAIETKTGRVIIQINPRFYRPAEVDHLVGDPTHANRKLDWEPSVSFDELIRMMVVSDYDAVSAKV